MIIKVSALIYTLASIAVISLMIMRPAVEIKINQATEISVSEDSTEANTVNTETISETTDPANIATPTTVETVAPALPTTDTTMPNTEVAAPTPVTAPNESLSNSSLNPNVPNSTTIPQTTAPQTYPATENPVIAPTTVAPIIAPTIPATAPIETGLPTTAPVETAPAVPQSNPANTVDMNLSQNPSLAPATESNIAFPSADTVADNLAPNTATSIPSNVIDTPLDALTEDVKKNRVIPTTAEISKNISTPQWLYTDNPRGTVILLGACPQDKEKGLIQYLHTGLIDKGWNSVLIPLPDNQSNQNSSLIQQVQKNALAKIKAPIILLANTCHNDTVLQYAAQPNNTALFTAYITLGISLEDIQNNSHSSLNAPLLDIQGTANRSSNTAYPITWLNAIRLAKGKRMELPTANIDFQAQEDKLLFLISHWLRSI